MLWERDRWADPPWLADRSTPVPMASFSSSSSSSSSPSSSSELASALGGCWVTMGGMAGADFFRSLPVVEAPVAAVLTYGSDVLSVMEKYAVLEESIEGKSL